MPRKLPTLFEVRYSKKPKRNNHWRIVGFVNGKRTQFWFKNEKDAKSAAAGKNAEITAYGTQVTLSVIDRVRAINAIERLTPFNRTLDDAVKFYLSHLNQISSSVPFSELAHKIRSEFRRRLEKNEVSNRHSESLHETLKKMESRFGGLSVCTITTEEVRSWLLGLPLAAKTRNKHRGYAAQIFNLAVDYGYLSANPVSKIKKFRERTSEANGEFSVLTSTETEKLFRTADASIIPFLLYSCGFRLAPLITLL
jgi:hypothetical protein